MAKELTPEELEAGKKAGWNILTFIIVVLLLISPYWLCNMKSEPDTRQWFEKDNSVTAILLARNYLDKQVKSPSQTKHPMDTRNCATKIDPITYRIRCYADTPNSFGVILRIKYDALVVLTGENTGQVVEFDLIE
jgi:hypothetical protein